MLPTYERRYTRQAGGARIETRRDGRPTIVGYAAVFYDPADPGTEYMLDPPDIVERIMPGCFDRALREDDVLARFNHDENLLLGRTRSGTLRLVVDRRGLRYEIDPPDTTVGRDVMELIRRGDLFGSSFRFAPLATKYRDDGGAYVVERHDVLLVDVGPVDFPAYTSTEAGLRTAGSDPAGGMTDTSSLAAIKARARVVEITMAE